MLSDNPDRIYERMPVEEVEITEQEVLDYLELLEEKINQAQVLAPPALLLLEELGVCPQSLIDVDIANVLELQACCSEYHVSPYDNVWMKNPNRVIEAFNCAKEGTTLYMRYNIKNIESSDGQPRTVPIGKNRLKR